MSFILKLISLIDNKRILTGDQIAGRISHVWHPDQVFEAKAVVLPNSTNEVAAILSLCNEYKQAVVAHGGLTNLVKSTYSSPDEVVISFELMNQVEEIDIVNRTVTVQAGAILKHLQQEVLARAMYFPLDFGARGSCQIGGCIATNAGGLKVIRYGMTRDILLGLEVVLADGTVLSSMNKMIKNNAGYDLKQLFIWRIFYQ